MGQSQAPRPLKLPDTVRRLAGQSPPWVCPGLHGPVVPRILCLPYNHLAGDTRVLCPQDGVRRLGGVLGATPPGAGDGVVVAVCSLSRKGQTSLIASVRGPWALPVLAARGSSPVPVLRRLGTSPKDPVVLREHPHLQPPLPPASASACCVLAPGRLALLAAPVLTDTSTLLPGALLKEAPRLSKALGTGCRAWDVDQCPSQWSPIPAPRPKAGVRTVAQDLASPRPRREPARDRLSEHVTGALQPSPTWGLGRRAAPGGPRERLLRLGAAHCPGPTTQVGP